MRDALSRVHEWLEETHASRFELGRHFFLRFFDSELVSTPGEWRVVAIGALAILLSSSIIFIQAYWHKYMALDGMASAEPFQMAVIADALFLITLAMFVLGLFSTLQWPALFPGLRDFLALASLPVRMRDVFAAKFAALMIFAGSFVIALAFGGTPAEAGHRARASLLGGFAHAFDTYVRDWTEWQQRLDDLVAPAACGG